MRYSGMFGIAEQVETAPGVWDDVITERSYVGDVVQTTETLYGADQITPIYRTTTSISVVSDGVLKESYENIRYVVYAGVRWTVSSTVFDWPRMTLYMGERYNGPEPVSPTPDPEGDPEG